MFKLEEFSVEKFDSILSKGLSHGLGNPNSQVCIEAAICQTLGLPHGDDPGCVSAAVRYFKIKLNDSEWSSPAARAKGLRDLGIAQLGSKGVVDGYEFTKLLAEKTIRIFIPKIFRLVFPDNEACLAAALRCEQEGTQAAAIAAASAASAAAKRIRATAAPSSATPAAYATAAYAASANAASAAGFSAAAYASASAAYASASAAGFSAAAYASASAAYASASAAYAAAAASAAGFFAAASRDEYLNLMASLALDVLRELKSPGIALL